MNIRVLSLTLTFLFLNFIASSADGPRIKYNFNSDWRLFAGDAQGAEVINFDDSDWKQITLPRAWNEDEAFKVAINKLTGSISWYRTHFKMPASDKGKKIFLEFEGVRQAADVYLNGKHLGLHENGAMAFGFDVTDLVKPGDNVVARVTEAFAISVMKPSER